MRIRIEDFTKHITESLTICDSTPLIPFNGTIENVLICGLGGSGIGGTIIAQIVAQDAKCPITINKDYKIPGFVNENTLVVCCSYSGNTEESLEMLEQAQAKNAIITCVTSGGKLEEITKEKNYNHIIIPKGHPPRGAFGFGFPPIFYLLSHYKVISNDYISQFKNAVKTIDTEKGNILYAAKIATEKLYNKIPVIYSDANYEGIAVRFRQQVNENSKMLCWHHVITKKSNHLHVGDWISLLLGEKKGIDISEVNVITHLKDELAKI